MLVSSVKLLEDPTPSAMTQTKYLYIDNGPAMSSDLLDADVVDTTAGKKLRTSRSTETLSSHGAGDFQSETVCQ